LLYNNRIIKLNTLSGSVTLVASLPGSSEPIYAKYLDLHQKAVVISDHISVVDAVSGKVELSMNNDGLATAATLDRSGQSLYVCYSRPSYFIPYFHNGGLIYKFNLSGTKIGKWKADTTHIWDIFAFKEYFCVITNKNMCKLDFR
jgi:hypothetical protein